MNNWIMIDDQYPTEREIVLLTDGCQIALGWYSKKHQDIFDSKKIIINAFIQMNTWRILDSVIAWHLLPELPKSFDYWLPRQDSNLKPRG